MSLNPLETSEKILKKYIDYLTTTFSLSDEELQQQLITKFNKKDKLSRGPILEATPPFRKGGSLKVMIEEGFLSREFYKLKAKKELPLERTLYLHQEKAIRKIIVNNRNIVVATGTGSGKTEAFLIPILNHLFLEKENSILKPGIRALLLYPMNALANDQLKRMRALLKNYPDITFGSYTGETEEYYDNALDRYHKMYNREDPLQNELISREQMKAEPPHILLTNYAMLEYLMLRPNDHVFFDGKYADSWKYLVLDEAHTYTGAKAIEMSMLLRRLKARVVDDKKQLKCIATSATIGSGEKDFPEVASFSSKLFDESFNYDIDDSLEQDVVQAYRKGLDKSNTAEWGGGFPELFLEWKEVIESNDDNKVVLTKVRQIAINKGIPENIINKAENKLNENDWKKFIYLLLKNNEKLIKLQRLLQEKPQNLLTAARKVFPRVDKPASYLIALVFLANKARTGEGKSPLLPARYHHFIRAIEGAYLCFLPEKILFLERKEKVKMDVKEFPVFEIATCRQCSALYLTGDVINKKGKIYLKQPGKEYYNNQKSLSYFLVKNQDTVTDNEDEIKKLKENNNENEEYLLCPSCGNISQRNSFYSTCECKVSRIVLIKVKDKSGLVHKCPACGSVRTRGSIVWRFLLGGDAVTSVLATSLYQQLPEKKIIKSENNKQNNAGWFDSNEVVVTQDEARKDEHKGRQLLIFSDSRQDAAFFATYLNSTYQQITRRQLIIQLIQEKKEKILNNNWRVWDLALGLKRYLQRRKLYPGNSLQQLEEIAWKWILYEFLAIDRKNSLEALGLLGFSLIKPDNFIAGPLQEQYELNDEESWTLFQILLNSFRKYGAVTYPDSVSPTNEFFAPRNREYYFKENTSEWNVYSWNPSSKGVLNSRLDFLLKLMEKEDLGDGSRKEAVNLLRDIWKFALRPGQKQGIFQDYFSAIQLSNKGEMYRLKLDYWSLVPTIINQEINWFYCPVCKRLTHYNLRGVCPTYRCHGELIECEPDKLLKNNHYRNLYLEKLPVKMKSSEHTAQLTTEAAADIQSKFVDRDINVLSCSTTFELGVDVGELESVFMRNVPPSAANYIQRAGRAGRRTDSTAFSLTFARRRSHDLNYFQKPLKMISGKINPPHFKIKNEKIIVRHIFATALAFFWRENPQYFKSVSNFFFTDGLDKFYHYLKQYPEDLKRYIKEITPQSDQNNTNIDIETGVWIQELIGKDGVITKAQEKLQDDIKQLEKREQELVEKKNYRKADVIKKIIRTIKSRYLINYMSRNNIIPKYGFPVDVVNLKIEHHGDIAKNLDLSRDLKIALSEYAPGSQVIAGGKLWTSRYIKMLPNRDLIKNRYAICDYCGNYHSKMAEISNNFVRCEACGRPLDGRKKGFFITPSFGFVSDKPEEPKKNKPQRTYTSRQYFTGKYSEDTRRALNLGKNDIKVELITASHGQLAVINDAGFNKFSICQSCGYAEINKGKPEKTHKTPWNQDCNGKRNVLALGHEFSTDILQIRFKDTYFGQDKEGYPESILYGILEGISLALDIERKDIDGCLYPYTGDPLNPAFVFYDSVPGGAGHVKRIIKNNNFIRVIKATGEIARQCECGGKEADTSCYGCLRNYRNQYCHHKLKRKYVLEFVKILIGS